MHRFGPIAHSCRTEGNILDQAHNPASILERNIGRTFQILLQDLAYLRMIQVLLRCHGHHETTGDILSQTGDLVRETCDILLADIGQQQIDQIGARSVWCPCDEQAMPQE